MVNAGRTAVFTFNKRGSLQNEPLVMIMIGSNKIENCEMVRFLDMQVDKNLQWSSHVDILLIKVSSGLFVKSNMSGLWDRYLRFYLLGSDTETYGIALWGS